VWSWDNPVDPQNYQRVTKLKVNRITWKG
jgi:hypothetical protein